MKEENLTVLWALPEPEQVAAMKSCHPHSARSWVPVPSPDLVAREMLRLRMSPQLLHTQLPGRTWDGWGLPWGVGSGHVGAATAHAQKASQAKQ